ncbi:MAG: hypothetical protein ACI87O_001601 [Planctomycetota bacterium]|jgi:hypothetical protein
MTRSLLLWFGLIGLLIVPVFAQDEGEASGPVPQKAIDAAIDRGMAFLVKEQDMDGSWRFDSPTHRAGITGFCVYTLLKGGLSKNHQAVQRGLRFLDVVEAATTYEAACMVLAYSEADGQHYQARMQDLTDQLVDWNEGAWAYPTSVTDVSNTHFGTLALHHARQDGLEIPEKTWKRIGKTIAQWQEKDGGIPYRPNGTVSSSMTAAGVGVACMVRVAAEELGNSQRGLSKDMESVIEDGLAWFEIYYNVNERPWPGNETSRRWDYYFLYALQRVGMLAPVKLMAGHDWYQDGARWLLKKQADAGSWGTAYGEDQSNTCLAILFLVRASGPSTGAKVPGKRVFRTADPDSDVTLVVAGEKPMRVWIEGFHELTKDSYEWPEEEGKGLRVVRVQYWSGDEMLAEVLGDGTVPCGDTRFAGKLLFDGPGPREIVAVIEVEPPPGDAEGMIEIRSEPLAIEVTTGLLPWMREVIEDHNRNLLRKTKVRVSASSSLNKHWEHGHVADGLMGRGWVCDKTDAEPWVTLDLDDAQRGNVLLFSHAMESGNDTNAFGRAKLLEVQLNKDGKKKWLRVPMNMDEGRKTQLVLKRMQKIRRITVRLLDIEPGLKHQGAGGLMEIELQSLKAPR